MPMPVGFLFCGTTRNVLSLFPMAMTSLFIVSDVDVDVVGQADVAERDGGTGGSGGVPLRLLSDGALLVRALHDRIRVLRAHPTTRRQGNNQKRACRSV